MSSISFAKNNVQRLLEIFSYDKPKMHESEDKITVHAAVSRFAFVYERIRNLVDYKDEHLIRKSAILRIQKRLLMLEKDPRQIAEQLIREMIAARYLPNGVLPQSLIDEVSWRIFKLQLVLRVNAGPESHAEWLRAMTAVEIEDMLVDTSREKGLASFLFDRVSQSIKVTGVDLAPADLRLQIYIACYRTLIKADDEILGYKLLRAFLPEWLSPQTWMNDPRPVAERMVAVQRRINLQLRHPLSLRFQRAVKPWAVALNIITDSVTRKPELTAALLQRPDELMTAVSKVIDERYAAAKLRVRRATVRATLYLFLTKMIIALLVEVPAEWFWYNEVHFKPLAVNLLFPPITMFMVGLFIKLPSQDNTDRIKTAVGELLGEGMPAERNVNVAATRSAFAKTGLGLTYLLTFLISFGGIVLLLELISFTWISTLIFIFFLCLVSFFAYRIRMGAREYTVVDPKPTLWTSLVDFFSIPILRAGRILSTSISRLNIFLFFFDFIFEAPYKLFLSVLEEWFAYAKEKKDELQP